MYVSNVCGANIVCISVHVTPYTRVCCRELLVIVVIQVITVLLEFPCFERIACYRRDPSKTTI